ncbi:5489_t:CDS:1, partial [Ambispora leptoticha]
TEAMNYLLEKKMNAEDRQHSKLEEEMVKKEHEDLESQGTSRASTPFSPMFYEADETMRQLAEDEFFSNSPFHQTINRRESIKDGQIDASMILRTL